MEDSIFKGFSAIDKYKPKVLFITNGIGAAINFQIVKYAALRGIKVITLVSEGNFSNDPNRLDEFLWGWNTEKKLYEDRNLQWSERTRNMTIIKYPELMGKVGVSGSCGCDIYKIKPQINSTQFLGKFHKHNYKKIIGIGCWDFDFAYEGGRAHDFSLKVFGSHALNRFKQDRNEFSRILNEIVANNPDVLFLAKEHPGNTGGVFMSGIDGIDKFNNVLILKKEPIIDCISVSDFWITYESTTVLEAWALDKQTCLLNPSGTDFPRANVHYGSPNYATVEALQSAIDDFYSKGSLPGFNEVSHERDKVMSETIQWNDGLNHVRVGNEIIKLMNVPIQSPGKPIPFSLLKEKVKQNLINTLKFSKSTIYELASSFNKGEVEAFSAEMMDYQIKFYLKLGLGNESLLNINTI